MGTDIHMIVEVRSPIGWVVQSWPNPYYGSYGDEKKETCWAYRDRNYDVFAILANVRNGRSFANVVTGDGFNYITDNRGLPVDASDFIKKQLDGLHSVGWVSLHEILTYDWTQTTKKQGWVTAVEFERWDRMKKWDPWPEEYCGGISGGSIVHLSAEEMRQQVKESIGDRRGEEYAQAYERFKKLHEHAYALIDWTVTYADAAKSFWVGWLPSLLMLADKPKNVRCVFGFDS